MTTQEQPTPPMNYRKLRIAWSVGWGIVAVLLCVLWVRSYWGRLTVRVQPNAARSVILEAETGSLTLCTEPRFARRFILITHSTGDEPPTPPVKAFGFRREHVVNDDGGLGWLRGFRNTMRFPHWFAVSIVTAVATIPWWRFSLRTLLIAMTLVAVVLGFAVWAVRR